MGLDDPLADERFAPATTCTSEGSSSVSFRSLTNADVAAVAALEKQIFPREAWSLGLVREEIASRWSHYRGAFKDGALIGYGGVKGEVDGDLMTIGVQEGARGQGIGRLLMRDLLDAARAAGMNRVFLEVRASNHPAQRLYESEGFRAVATVTRYYHHPTEDAVVMCLTL